MYFGSRFFLSPPCINIKKIRYFILYIKYNLYVCYIILKHNKMEKYFTQEYKQHLVNIEVAEANFKNNPCKETATIYSNLKNNPFKGNILTEEGHQVKEEARKRSRIELAGYFTTLRNGK